MAVDEWLESAYFSCLLVLIIKMRPDLEELGRLLQEFEEPELKKAIDSTYELSEEERLEQLPEKGKELWKRIEKQRMEVMEVMNIDDIRSSTQESAAEERDRIRILNAQKGSFVADPEKMAMNTQDPQAKKHLLEEKMYLILSGTTEWHDVEEAVDLARRYPESDLANTWLECFHKLLQSGQFERAFWMYDYKTLFSPLVEISLGSLDEKMRVGLIRQHLRYPMALEDVRWRRQLLSLIGGKNYFHSPEPMKDNND